MYLQRERHVDSPRRMRQVCVSVCVAGVLAEGVFKKVDSQGGEDYLC